MKTKVSFGDSLYWFQLVCALMFSVFQLKHMIFNSTKGLSMSMFLFVSFFVALNLVLAINAHRVKPSKVTMQTIVIYTLGALTYGSFIVVLTIKSEVVWDNLDSLTSVLVSVAIAGTLYYASLNSLALLDPLMKGIYSFIFKAVPQLVLAWKVWQVGGAGLSIVMVATFHLLTCARIYQIGRSIKEEKLDRNRLGLVVSEIGNEGSWILVTLAWLVG